MQHVRTKSDFWLPNLFFHDVCTKMIPLREAKTLQKMPWEAKMRFWRAQAKFQKSLFRTKINFWGHPLPFLELWRHSGAPTCAQDRPRGIQRGFWGAKSPNFHRKFDFLFFFYLQNCKKKPHGFPLLSAPRLHHKPLLCTSPPARCRMRAQPIRYNV